MTTVTIIDTGIANTASVTAAFERLGMGSTLSRDPSQIADAPLAVLPGVGSFGAGMSALREHNTDRAIIDRITQDRPTLAICLGLQLLCRASEESPRVQGLGIIDATVTRFPSSARTPQHGWNSVDDAYAYFSNTYRLDTIPSGWTGSLSNHAGPFVAYLRRGKTLACQFHPELSGVWGANLIESWTQSVQETTPC